MLCSFVFTVVGVPTNDLGCATGSFQLASNSQIFYSSLAPIHMYKQLRYTYQLGRSLVPLAYRCFALHFNDVSKLLRFDRHPYSVQHRK